MLRKNKALCPQDMASSFKRKTVGQSTIEYIILVAVIIGAILTFAATFKTNWTTTMGSATNGMINMADRLQSSRFANMD